MTANGWMSGFKEGICFKCKVQKTQIPQQLQWAKGFNWAFEKIFKREGKVENLFLIAILPAPWCILTFFLSSFSCFTSYNFITYNFMCHVMSWGDWKSQWKAIGQLGTLYLKVFYSTWIIKERLQMLCLIWYGSLFPRKFLKAMFIQAVLWFLKTKGFLKKVLHPEG